MIPPANNHLQTSPKSFPQIPGYSIIEEIYTGSRTAVYRGLQINSQLSVVIKILYQAYPSFNELLQFRNQYTITKNLNIPGIVRPLSLENYKNTYILVMEDCNSISLREYTKNQPLLLTNVLEIALQVSEILHHLHASGVIHKDIKPANILINTNSLKVNLIDFSISSLLPKETKEIQNPNVLEGTLAYLAPEQTGRMNRGIDYRADFYSLGVTLYELLTGELPFLSNDALEVVHSHIAKMPVPPHLINKNIPPFISEIIFKLMAKNAEDRYQSALGLKHDLEMCLQQWQQTGKISPFELGKKDICQRFLILEKLYGRQQEVKTLLDAFERVSDKNNDNSKSEMMLVAGFAGIGKTAVINEVHKPITRQKGYFIKGKFDQFNRNIPLGAFVQAMGDLIGQLLSESETQLQTWKNQIVAALGNNAQVLIGVIPELEKIIGPQPPTVELSGTAAQNRFNLLLQKFLAVFTKKDHPLVIFLDDLQWADLASFQLIKLLMEEKSYLLLLGAYRDNEVQPTHPLILTVEDLKKAGNTVHKITLNPLPLTDTNQLVADTLHCPVERARPLSELINRKTQGNPFFITQFLKLLYDEKLVKFNSEQGYWECDIPQINALALTDDVVEFMANKLQKLPKETQQILKLAACIGNYFDLETLAIVSKESPTDVAQNLWQALQEELIIPQSEVYKFYLLDNEINANADKINNVEYRFLHDRIQQAAYSLIPDQEQQITHYNIGQLLLQKLSFESRIERIFELVNQLNYGINLINSEKERHELAELNLIACRKARAATAYQAGRNYADKGLLMLGKNSWEQQYEMSLVLHDLAAELAALCGDFEAMENFIQIILAKAQFVLDTINAFRLKIQTNFASNNPKQAIAIAQKILQQLGVDLPANPTEIDTQQATAEIKQLIGNQEIEALIDLPLMTDKEKIAIVQIINSVIPSAYISGSPLLPVLVSLGVKISILYGNTSASCFAYVIYGMFACNFLKDVETGVKFGQLALSLVSKLDDKASKPEVLDVFGGFLLYRKSHLKETLPLVQAGYTIAVEVGSLEVAGYNAHKYCLNSFWCGQPLVSLEEENRAYYHSLVQLNQVTGANYNGIYWQSILNLLEMTENPLILFDDPLKETEFLSTLTSSNDLYGLFTFYLNKMMLSYLFEAIELARFYAVNVRKNLIAGAGNIGEVAFYFYDSLSLLDNLNYSKNQHDVNKQVEANQAYLQEQWAKYAPMNYQHKIDLVEAEKSRVFGKKSEAIELYDKAILGAKENEYLQDEALSNELAAKFYLEWGKDKVAAGYMQEAYYCYARWGAKAKVTYLEQNYPKLLGAILQPHNLAFSLGDTIASTLMRGLTSSSSSDNLWLDFPAVVKAAQAISQEIKLEKLLAILMQIVIENAGAQTGHLILLQDEEWLVVAECKEETKILRTTLEEYPDLPHSLIYSVSRNQKTAVFDNFSISTQFAADQYLTTHQPKSVLCTPISRSGKLIGILYLENNLTVGAFTTERLEILQLFTSQAAISLENARLYQQTENYSQTLKAEVEIKTQDLNQKAHDLEQALKTLQQTQTQLIQSEKMSSLGQLVAGIAHEINNPVNFIKGNLIHTKSYLEDLNSLLTVYMQEYPDPTPAIIAKKEEIDINFLFQDLNKIIDSMTVGSLRISQIVQSLRNFSRLDEAKVKWVDIHSGLDSTLLILQNRLKGDDKFPEITVIKEYSPLPLVKCYASELNQVFMNILSNAIDALIHGKKSSTEWNKQPTITIRTFIENSNYVVISIADNGLGIDHSLIHKIFDPFFTTKPVGSGTGLGLSISYSIIVEKHQGQLSCISVPQEGAEFIIKIPL
ncbi:MAG TPA: AAA family ATPase [Halomicronema sp.]